MNNLIKVTTLSIMFMVFATISVVANEKIEPESFVIFNNENLVNPDYQLCNNDNAKHGVRVEKNSNNINQLRWRWARKRNCWCGFGINNFSFIGNDFSKYEKLYNLVIKLKGSWTRNAPQIKFMDNSKASSKLIRIQKYLNGDPKSPNGAVVSIPLKDFDLSWSLNINNLETIQFDAAYESDSGDLIIYEIRIEKNKSR